MVQVQSCILGFLHHHLGLVRNSRYLPYMGLQSTHQIQYPMASSHPLHPIPVQSYLPALQITYLLTPILSYHKCNNQYPIYQIWTLIRTYCPAYQRKTTPTKSKYLTQNMKPYSFTSHPPLIYRLAAFGVSVCCYRVG